MPFWEIDHETEPTLSSPKRVITMNIKRSSTYQTEIVISVALKTATNGHLADETIGNMEHMLKYHEIDFDSVVKITEETSDYVSTTIPRLDDPTATDLEVIVKIIDHNPNAIHRIDLDVFTIDLRETRQETYLGDDYDVCAICYELLGTGGEINTLCCGHSYHHHCVLGWVNKNLSCPCCRVRLA